MSDYISRQAAIEKAQDMATAIPLPRLVVEEVFKQIPAADVRENVSGEWLPDMIYDGEDEWCFVECSNCKYRVDEHYNFCPNCGADMRGDNNGKSNEQ